VPKAFGQKFHYLEHDAAEVSEAPPVLNQWYTLFDDTDVRLLMVIVIQTNDELAAKTIEMRWTVDGTVYSTSFNCANNTEYYVYRDTRTSADPTGSLSFIATMYTAMGRYLDKRGQTLKVEVRITSALGTNQTLVSRAVYETLELT